MNGITITSLVTGIVLTFFILHVLQRRRKSNIKSRERLTNEAIHGHAVVMRLRSLGYVMRSGSEDPDDPRGFEVTLRFAPPGRKSLDVEVKQDIRPSDMEAWQVGASIPVRYVPDDPANFRFLSTADTSDAETIETTAAHFSSPVWTFGLSEADGWLLPAPSPTSPFVLVCDISDPHTGSGSDRVSLIDSAAFLLAEHLRMNSDARVNSAVLIQPDKGKLILPTGDLGAARKAATDMRAQQDEPCVMIWGAARESFSADVEIRFWLPGENEEHTWIGSVYDLGEGLLEELVSWTAARLVRPPTWYQRVEAAELADYAQLLDQLQLLILADQKNQAIAALDDEAFDAWCEGALDSLTGERAQSVPFVLTALAIVHYAARAGKLTLALRMRALEILSAFRDRNHPVYRLSPFFYAIFGEPEEAIMRRDVLISAADDRYKQWLESLEINLPGTVQGKGEEP